MSALSNTKLEVPPSQPPLTAAATLSSPWHRGLPYVLLSLLLLIPCFWHAHIEAGDLGSHVYNAWLAQLIHQGKAPGLYLVWQWDNVFFDLLLYNLSKFLGFTAAEKIAVSFCVLVFFWGLFSLMKAASGRAPWFFTPCIAMLTYGYIFHMGFLNYYLSLGLGALGVSLVWSPRKKGLIAAALLMPFMLFAHPMGLLWFIGIAGYRFLWLRFSGWWKLLLPAGALLVFYAARVYVARHGFELEWREKPFWTLNGADELHVFGERYVWFAITIGLFFVLASAVAFFQQSSRLKFWTDRRLLLELYFISFLGSALLPENLHLDPTGGWVGALATRLTLSTAMLGLCWLASLPQRSWHLGLTAVCAIVFFVFLYQDTAFLARMEASARRITQTLPFGTRTVATIFAPSDYRTIYLHIPDRACIGHCFLISNYEPATRQFRVRVQQGSPVASASVDDTEDMQSGTYDVQDEDLPLKQIYQCNAKDLTQICIRDLSSDEKNGRLGYHPVDNPFFSQNP